MNAPAGRRLHVRVHPRVDEDHPVLIEQPRVALDVNPEVPLVPERDPRGPVGEGVRTHAHRDIQRRAHPRAGLAIPAAARRSDVDLRLAPQLELLAVGARIVAARGERGAGAGDRHEARDRIVGAGDLGRVRGGTDDHEVVVHEVESLDAEPVGDERFLGGLRVHEQHVSVAVARVAKRLPGADRDDPHLDAGLGGEPGQEMVEQTRVPGGGRRLDDDEFRCVDHRLRRGGAQAGGGENRGDAGFHAVGNVRAVAARFTPRSALRGRRGRARCGGSRRSRPPASAPQCVRDARTRHRLRAAWPARHRE